MSDDINYLSMEDILEAHEIGFSTFGERTEGIDHGCVEKRMVEPQTAYFGDEQYPGLFKKAAVYMYYIAISHCFAGGNKRASFLSTDLFLKYNGYSFVVNQRELYDFCCTIADHRTRPELEEVEEWIKQNVQPFTITYNELFDLLD